MRLGLIMLCNFAGTLHKVRAGCLCTVLRIFSGPGGIVCGVLQTQAPCVWVANTQLERIPQNCFGTSVICAYLQDRIWAHEHNPWWFHRYGEMKDRVEHLVQHILDRYIHQYNDYKYTPIITFCCANRASDCLLHTRIISLLSCKSFLLNRLIN